MGETTGIYPDAVEKSPVTTKYIQEHYTMIRMKEKQEKDKLERGADLGVRTV